MNTNRTSFPDAHGGCWEQRVLDLVLARPVDPPSEAGVFSTSNVANTHPVDALGAPPLPPPPQWGVVEPTYASLLDEGMEALLDKRYADAHAIYSRALELEPAGAEATTVRGNLKRLRELMQQP